MVALSISHAIVCATQARGCRVYDGGLTNGKWCFASIIFTKMNKKGKSKTKANMTDSVGNVYAHVYVDVGAHVHVHVDVDVSELDVFVDVDVDEDVFVDENTAIEIFLLFPASFWHLFHHKHYLFTIGKYEMKKTGL